MLLDNKVHPISAKFNSLPNLVILFVLISVFIVIFTATFSWYSWLTTKDREINHLSTVSSLGGKSLNAYFRSYESGLNQLRTRIVEYSWPLDLKGTEDLLKRFHSLHPELGNVNLSNPDGQFLASAVMFPGPLPRSRQTSFVLTTQELQNGAEFTIGRPILGKILGEWVIPMRTAIRDKSGKLVYILSATLPLSRQQIFWQNIFLPENFGIGLLRDDLYMLSRYPIPQGDTIDKTYTEPRSGVVATFLQHNMFPKRGKGSGFNSVTGFESLFSFHRLKDYPLTLFVNIPVSGVSDNWLQQTRPFFTLIATLLGCSLLVAYFIHKRQAAIEQERRKSEQLLHLSEERFMLAMQGASDGLWDWNLETDDVYYSPHWKSMLGYQEDEIEHRLDSWKKLVHPDDKDHITGAVKDYMEGRRNSFEVELRMRHKQGGWVHILSRAFLVKREPDNKPVRLIGTHVDLTVRKQAESETREALATLDATQDGAYIFDAETFRFSYVNSGAIKQTGYTRDELLRMTPVDIKPQYDETQFRELIQPLVDGSVDDIDFRTVHRCKDGHEVPVEISLQYITLPDLPPRFAAIARDISDRKAAEESMELAALVYQSSSEAMSVTDTDGTIITVNPAFTTLTGYTVEEIIGENLSILRTERGNYPPDRDALQQIQTTGKWIGEVRSQRKNGETYIESQTVSCTYNDDGSIHHLVFLSSDITDKKASEEIIWHQANFDPLTRLPNRRMFRDRLNQKIKEAERANHPLALMFLDLDRFKEVNDTLGHEMGDRLLTEAAERLCSCVRETDTVARLGGDEFTIILSNLEEPGNETRIIQDILTTLSKPFQIENQSVFVSASVGITFYPKDADNIERLIRNADQAMYAAKRKGRNRFSYFTPEIHKAVQNRIQLAGDLRTAINEQQFVLHYQPIVELATGKIQKAEALIRWQHPERGLVEPADFIPIAEENGMINEIGDWVFFEVTSQTSRWKECHDLDMQISINKSPAQFHSENGGDRAWIDHLKKMGHLGENIIIEITEGLLLDISASVTEQLLALRDAGIQVSLDDFGTGYSSLSYLKKLDIDYLKIDRSFVQNLRPESEDMILIEAIIMMAHKLGIKVIAEGVETRRQRDLLYAAGSDYVQGFFFSKPIPADSFQALCCGINLTESLNLEE